MKNLFCTVAILCAMFTVSALPGEAQTAPSDYFDTVQKVYIGYYQRPGDPGGLLYWAQRLATANGNLNEIIEAYANSPESQALYGAINGNNIGSVVDAIYMALFHRHAETGGLNYYVNGFNAGHFTAATIMLNVLDGAQNSDLASVNNKLAAANLFTRTIDPELDGLNLQVTYSGNADAIAARNWLASVTDDPATVPSQDETTAYMRSYIADPGDPILTYSGSSVERALAQTGLSIALASNVLQSQIQVFFKTGSKSLPCSALNGGGSVKTCAIQTTVVGGQPLYPVNVYYDNHCTRPYIAVEVTGATSTGTGTGILLETVTYYGLDGTSLGTMTLSETLVETSDLKTIEAHGLGTFTPAGGLQTPVQLGLSCDLSLSGTIFPCIGGVVQDFPALGLAIGSVTSLTLNIPGGAFSTGAVTFTGESSVVTGPIGSLTMTNPSSASFVIQGGTPYTTTTAGGGAAALALFPPTPTGWTLTDQANDLTLDITVTDNTARDLSLTITQVSTAKTLVTGTIDQSGTGTITYSNGTSAAITNWTLAD
jgi:hypothetical protein